MTAPQRQVLEAIREIGRDGWPVSVREVQEKLGYSSVSTAHAHMEALQRLGLIERSPRAERSGWICADQLDIIRRAR